MTSNNFSLHDFFKNNLQTEHFLRDLIDLLYDKNIVFDPYYQRNYVWNTEKASYFIESLIIGTEIPPIVLFEENEKYSEIIDGRQRFETVKRFINNEFKLKKSGLNIIKIYKDHYFKDLPLDIQNHIKNSKVRIFKYKLGNNLSIDDSILDLVKKDIFTRYNIGITPLKQFEIEKAIFIENDLNTYIKNKLISNEKLQDVFCRLFIKEKDLKRLTFNKKIELILKKIRFLVVLPEIPINYYSWTSGKNDLINSFFKYISNEANPNEVFNKFKENVLILDSINNVFIKNNFSANPLIFEALFWMLSVIKCENLDLSILKYNLESITENIINNSIIFIEEQSHYYKNTITRYGFIAKMFEALYDTDFDKYITTSDLSKEKVKLAKDNKRKKEIKKQVNKLITRKTDPYTIMLSSYMSKMRSNKFDIRPSYQREESMNIQKASGLIESILLDFKIAPIYIYIKKDGTQEVLDGQQRLLAVLAFLGLPFKNIKGNDEYSKKNEFKLTGLKIFKEYNKFKFSDLPENIQNRIKNFTLSIIELNENHLPELNPIDLFIRLNNKPYPIKEHSFEMWNSSINKNIVNKIKEITNKHSDWLYLRVKNSNKRMQNEEFITNLIYLETERLKSRTLLNENSSNQFVLFAKATHLSCLVKNKKDITIFLNKIEQEKDLKPEFDNSINALNEYIDKIERILTKKTNTLKEQLDILICPNKGVRTLQCLFLVWFILTPLNCNCIDANQEEIYSKLKQIVLSFKKNYVEAEKDNILISFRNQVQEFWDTYLI